MAHSKRSLSWTLSQVERLRDPIEAHRRRILATSRVVRALRDEPGLSTAEITERTGMSRLSVWIELQHLMADGIVVGATRNGYRVWKAESPAVSDEASVCA